MRARYVRVSRRTVGESEAAGDVGVAADGAKATSETTAVPESPAPTAPTTRSPQPGIETAAVGEATTPTPCKPETETEAEAAKVEGGATKVIESTLAVGTVLVVELPEPCVPEPHEPTPETETATARGKTATEGATVDVEGVNRHSRWGHSVGTCAL